MENKIAQNFSVPLNSFIEWLPALPLIHHFFSHGAKPMGRFFLGSVGVIS